MHMRTTSAMRNPRILPVSVSPDPSEPEQVGWKLGAYSESAGSSMWEDSCHPSAIPCSSEQAGRLDTLESQQHPQKVRHSPVDALVDDQGPFGTHIYSQPIMRSTNPLAAPLQRPDYAAAAKQYELRLK
jgi:hypothetical protein